MLKVKMPLKAARAAETKVDCANQSKKEPPSKMLIQAPPRRAPRQVNWYDNLPSFNEVLQFVNVNFGSFSFSREPTHQRAETTSKIKINTSSRIVPKKHVTTDQKRFISELVDFEPCKDKQDDSETNIIRPTVTKLGEKSINEIFAKEADKQLLNLPTENKAKKSLIKAKVISKLSNQKQISKPSQSMLTSLMDYWNQKVIPQKQSIQEVRERAKNRSNWNLFVGDNTFKTTFYLEFLVGQTSQSFSNWKISSAIFSFRLLIILFFFYLIYLEDKCGQIRYQLNGPNFDQILSPNIFRSVLKNWKNLVFLALSLIGIQRRDLSLNQRKLLMHMLQVKLFMKIILLYDSTIVLGKDAEVYLIIMNGIGLLNGMMVLDSWPMFACVHVAMSLTALICLNFFATISFGFPIYGISLLSFFKTILPYVMFATCVFACFEKINKERFIVNHTNEKTRKFLLNLLDKQVTGQLIINKNCEILFFNQAFEQFATKKIKFAVIPTNLKQFTEDNESSEQLKLFIGDYFDPKKKTNEEPKTKSIELRIRKQTDEVIPKDGGFVKEINSKDINLARRLSVNPGLAQNEIEESKLPNSCYPHAQTYNEEFFLKYEVIKIEASSFYFKEQKSLILTIQNISEHKAELHLINLHVKLLTQFVNNFKNKIEKLELKEAAHERSYDGQNNSQNSLIETLGNSFLMLNSMLQIQHQFQVITNQVVDNDQDFLLADEVKYAIQGISISMNPHVNLSYSYENNLPLKVKGNLEKFKLAILTALEFGIKYCQQGEIKVKVDFDSLSDDRKIFMVSFAICMELNKSYNEKPIFEFLNEYQKKKEKPVSKPKQKSGFFQMEEKVDEAQNQRKWEKIKNTMNIDEDNFANRYKVFCELTKNFGMGMIILPSIVWQLGGYCSAQYRKRSSCGMGTTLQLLSQNQSQNDLSRDIWITFKVPLQQVDDASISLIQSPFQNSRQLITNNNNKTPSIISSPFAKKREVKKIKAMVLPFPKKAMEAAQAFQLQQQDSEVKSAESSSRKTFFLKAGSHQMIEINTPVLEKSLISQSPEKSMKNGRQDSKNNVLFICKNGSLNELSSDSLGNPRGKQRQNLSQAKVESKFKSPMFQNDYEEEDSVLLLEQSESNKRKNSRSVSQTHQQHHQNIQINQDEREVYKTESNEHVDIQVRLKAQNSLSGFSQSQVNVADISSGQHLPANQILKQSQDDDSEMNLENVDEYFLSEDYNDFIADKIFKKSPDNSQLGEAAENQQKKISIAAILQKKNQNNENEVKSPLCALKDDDSILDASRNKLKNNRNLKPVDLDLYASDVQRRKQMDEACPQFQQIQNALSDVEKQQKEFQERMQENKRKIALAEQIQQIQPRPVEEQIDTSKPNVRKIQTLQKVPGYFELGQALHDIQEVDSRSSRKVQVQLMMNQSQSIEIRDKSNDSSLWGSLIDKNKKIKTKPKGVFKLRITFTQSDQYVQKQKEIIFADQQEHELGLTLRKWKMQEAPRELERQHRGSLNISGDIGLSRTQSLLSCNGIVGFNASKAWCQEKRFSLLLVDDNPFALVPFTQIAKELKANYIVCEDGKSAVDEVNKSLQNGELFDLIFMDLFMPGMNGDEATKKIRVLEQKHQMNEEEKQFILGCSGDFSENLNKRCLDSGMNMLVQKPISMQSFQQILLQNNKSAMRKTHLELRFGNE